MDVPLTRVSGFSESRILAPLFALSLFTSAALLFWVQPLVAKMLLPLLGGAPAVWNTCMVFFQALLLLGYAYALFISRKLSLTVQALLHAVLMLLGFVVLPFGLSQWILSSIPTGRSPFLWLISTLFIIVGPPFFVLSATAPLLQRWFSHSDHKAAKDPYFLYAVSNAGSMLVLLAFPLLLEPALTVRAQSRIWAFGYAALVILIMTSALVVRKRVSGAPPEASKQVEFEPVTTPRRLQWILWAFVPSSLMLGVTSFIATDIASVPLIWIIPLALYLTTFIAAFSTWQLISLQTASFMVPVAIICLGVFQILRPPVSIFVTIAVHLVTFFIIAFLCHRRLALSRPPVSSLAEFYLWIAVGGVLGGIFNSLIAPLVFTTTAEYPLAIVLGCLSRPDLSQANEKRSRWKLIFPSVVFLLTFGLSYTIPRFHFSERIESGLVLFVPLIFCWVITFRSPAVFGLGLGALMIGAIPYLNASIDTLSVQRNFFGVWRVADGRKDNFRSLYHGTTIHGVQFLDPSRKCEATSYYNKDGPLGQIFDVYNASNSATHSVAAVGLGAGTIGSYSQAGQQWDFYDIDPAIIQLASDQRYFTFLSDCTAGSYRIIPGDARLRLTEANRGQYGLIVMDAFSSDSVPAHLLTIEAMSLYFSKLSQDGLLAFHISNRYLDLEPLLAGLSRHGGFSSYIRYDERARTDGRFPATWVVVARSDEALGALVHDQRWRRLKGDVIWSDDFSNILGVLR